jgi:hypothetical protein
LSARLETKPSEAVKALTKPLVSEATTDREPVRDLNSEFFSARPETEPSEPVKALARPLA